MGGIGIVNNPGSRRNRRRPGIVRRLRERLAGDGEVLDASTPDELGRAVERFRAARVEADPALFQAMVRAMFGQRRKGLVNALKAFAEDLGVSAAAVVTQAGLDPLRRPETLELTELARLAELFASAGRA
jgi:hypothetical protein